MTCDGHDRAHRAAEGVAAVGRKITDIQDGIADKQGKRHQRVDETYLQCRADDARCEKTSQGFIPPKIKIALL